MLEAVAPHLVAEQKQKVIVLVVVRAEKLVCLRGEILMHLQLLGSHLQVFGLVGKNVEEHRVSGRRREINAAVVEAGVNGRIHKCVEGGALEVDGVAGLGSGFQRGCVFPSGGKLEGGVDGDVAGEESRRIHHHFVPREIGDGVADLDTAGSMADGREIVKVHAHGLCAIAQRHV